MEQQYSLSRRTFLAGSAVAAATAGLALSGCGSSSSSEGGKPSGSAANTGGVITAACSYKNANYNPIGASSALMLPAIQHCLEGLYELDYFTGKSNAALAAGEPVKVSETEYEVALREGATFSNGEAVTAADVVAVIEANKANATYKDMLSFIDTVAAKDDATVSFTLAYPFVDSDKQLKERLSLCRVFPAAEIDQGDHDHPADRLRCMGLRRVQRRGWRRAELRPQPQVQRPEAGFRRRHAVARAR